jgi:hypothetical protein
MIPIQIDNATQVAITKAGLRRAIDYIPQWEGVTVKRNYQNDRERLNFPAFVWQSWLQDRCRNTGYVAGFPYR